MCYMETYESWLASEYIDSETKEELRQIAGNEKEIEDRFYKDLEFGTGGLRGVIGAGTNRLNIYTVRKATQGLANFIISEKGQNKGCGDCLRFPTYVTGIFQGSSTVSECEWH